MNKVLTCVRLPWKGRMKFEIMFSFLLALLLETIMIRVLISFSKYADIPKFAVVWGRPLGQT